MIALEDDPQKTLFMGFFCNLELVTFSVNAKLEEVEVFSVSLNLNMLVGELFALELEVGLGEQQFLFEGLAFDVELDRKDLFLDVLKRLPEFLEFLVCFHRAIDDYRGGTFDEEGLDLHLNELPDVWVAHDYFVREIEELFLFALSLWF